MKKLLILPLISGLIALTAFRDHLEKRTLATYYIKESKLDTALQKSESLFVISFLDDNAKPITTAIKLSYNGIEKTVASNDGKFSQKVKPGKYCFQFFYNKNYYEIKTDSISIKPQYKTELCVNFESSVNPVICDKPVIYVYPAKTEAVSIQLDLKGNLGFTYPEYKNGWNFTADPDGTIHMGDKKYSYLFWDGNTAIDNQKINWEEGFAVTKDSLVPFFEKQLSAMGLNSKEIDDYITYWCPRMNVNERNYIHFMFNDEYNEYASLNITPKPDHVFRVFMFWTKIDRITEVKPQATSTFQRSGFSVVEWGGAEMKEYPQINKVSVAN